MNDRDRKAAIYALQQAQQGIDVALSMLEAAEQALACMHPPEARQDLRGLSTSGPEHFWCKACGREVDRRAETAGHTNGTGGAGDAGGAEALPGTGWPELPDGS